MSKIQSVSSTPSKQTIYVDVDDDITSIIDKVASAHGKIIALVLPKRCAVLQSAVNMKLLKRSADTAQKNLVLVTSEAGLLPLAGNAGLFVASTPTSKPAVPSAPVVSDEPETVAEDDPLPVTDHSTDDFDKAAVAETPVGTLASTDGDVDDAIDLSTSTDAPANAVTDEPAIVAPGKKDHKLKVPSFNRLKITLGVGIGALVVVIAAIFFATQVLPSATITLKTDSSTITTNATLTLDTTAKSLDIDNSIVPAQIISQQKTASQQVPATGQQNNGDKATGTVVFTAQAPTMPASIKAGSSVKSVTGQTYILQGTATWQVGAHAPYPSQNWNWSTSPVDITALNGGKASNTDGTVKFTSSSNVAGTGSADGGSDNIITVVSQTDIDNATAKITSTNSDTVKKQLGQSLAAKGLQAVPITFVAATPTVTSDVQVGAQATAVTVTSTTTYTMFGVQKADLANFVKNNVDDQIEQGKQSVLDDGVANADFTIPQPPTATAATVAMQVKTKVGPQLDVKALKTQLAGDKVGDVKSTLGAIPGVEDVQVKLSPFWVGSVPHKAGKVNIVITKAN